MRIYDTVVVPCHSCGLRLEFQSKAGPCSMNEWSPQEASDAVLVDIAGQKEQCANCGRWTECRLEQRPVVTFVKLEPTNTKSPGAAAGALGSGEGEGGG